MSVSLSDLKLYGSAVMADDELVTEIGGAIDTSKKVVFTDFGGSMQIVSSDDGDTQVVTIFFRDSARNILSEAQTLDGQTPVACTGSPERLLKAVKSPTGAGDVAVEAAVAEREGTAQGGTENTIILDSEAPGVDGYYNGMIVRIPSGTGIGQIREGKGYNGTTKVLTVNSPWDVIPEDDSAFRIAKGFFFDKTPSEVLEVRRPFYNAGANAAGGATKKYREKVFYKNTAPTGSPLTEAQVIEDSDPSGVIAFGLAATLDDVATNGVGHTRLVAPSGIVFNSSTKDVANGGSLTGGSAQGVWLELTLVGGEAELKTTYGLQLKGNPG